MSVERVITFPLGGELKWALGGLAVGVAASVLPLELIMLLPLWPFVLFVRGVAARSLRSAHLAFTVCAFAVMVAAVAAPLGHRYERVRVSRTTMPLGQLAEELHIGSLPWAELVTLPSLTPTWREVEDAVASQTPLEVRFGVCGNGVTLLFGAYPMRRSIEPAL